MNYNHTSGLFGYLLILIIIPVFLRPLHAQKIEKQTKKGLAVQIGNGLLYGGIGGLVEYQFPLKNDFRITPYSGLGLSTGGTDTSSAIYLWLCTAVGFNVEYGGKNRLIFGPQFIASHNFYNSPQDAMIDKENIYGPSFIMGYKGTVASGFIVQLAIGSVFLQNPLIPDKNFHLHPHVGAGIGYKF